MALSISPANVDDEWPHHVFRVRRIAKVYRGGHGRAESVDSAVRRVKSLHVVEVIRDSPHLDHPVTVVGCEPLDLGPPVSVVSKC
jgi:hypothetical protein